MPAVLATLPTADLRRCFDQGFLASAWYDIFPFDSLLAAAARLLGLRYEVFLNQVFEAQAARDQRGVYKLLLHAISPEMLVKASPRIGTQLFNFTTSEECARLPPATGRMPSRVSLCCCRRCTARAQCVRQRALRTTGAKDFQHRWLEPRPRPMPTAWPSHGGPRAALARRAAARHSLKTS